MQVYRPTPRDLTRHAVLLGATGCGKTGLVVSIGEDLAGQGVPVLVIDPKGDLGSFALILPSLQAAAFLPWIDHHDAERQGLTPEAAADATAQHWRAALATDGYAPDDLARHVARTEVQILTPGSDRGRPVDVISTLSRAPLALRHDAEGRLAWITGLVGALLALVDLPVDPVTDPRAILLTHLYDHAFAAGRDLPLQALLPGIVDPPFTQLGIYPVDEVVPPDDRSALALRLNTLLASPTLAAWQTGEPMDLDAWLRPLPDGRTPIRVLSLAHLSDAERMFFVTTLLHAIVAWSRRQPGTSALRAAVIFDEVWGFLPPHPKNPPSKDPLLTLLKQARAVGLGLVLCTQNPVDLDYKAAGNAGTWIVGRLRTAQDRARVLAALADLGDDADALTDQLAGLPTRQFLVRGPDGGARVVRSRQTFCFLRGPLTRAELRRLRHPSAPPPPAPDGVSVAWLHPTPPALAAEADPDGPARQPALYVRLLVDLPGATDAIAVHRLWFPLSAERRPRAMALSPDHLHPSPADEPHAPLPAFAADGPTLLSLLGQVREQVAEGVRTPEGLTRPRPGGVAVAWFGIVWIGAS